MKKRWIAMAAAFTVFCLGCAPEREGEPEPGPEIPEGYACLSLLTDHKFERGFKVRGLGRSIYGDLIELYEGEETDPSPEVCLQYDQEGQPPPEWTLAQWATRYSLRDRTNSAPGLAPGKINYSFEELGESRYKYENSSKRIVVDTKTGEYSLGLKASECFREPRTANQEWPHWFIERNIYNQPDPPVQCRVASSESLKVRFDVRLNAFTDHMGEEANPGLHSGMCVFYLYLANRNPDTKKFDDMLWLGLIVYDNRFVLSPLQSFPDGGKQSATDKWIYNIPTSAYFSEYYNLKTPENRPIIGQWRSVDLEMLGFIEDGLIAAQSAGYMRSASWENLYINGMYFGYETPGTYDIDMSFRNLDIVSLVEG